MTFSLTPDTSESSEKIGTSFPLLRIFGFVLLPLLVIGGFGLGVTMIAGMSASSESLFAQSDVRLVRTIVPRSPNGTIEPEPTPRMLAELKNWDSHAFRSSLRRAHTRSAPTSGRVAAIRT